MKYLMQFFYIFVFLFSVGCTSFSKENNKENLNFTIDRNEVFGFYSDNRCKNEKLYIESTIDRKFVCNICSKDHCDKGNRLISVTEKVYMDTYNRLKNLCEEQFFNDLSLTGKTCRFGFGDSKRSLVFQYTFEENHTPGEIMEFEDYVQKLCENGQPEPEK